MMRLKCLLMTGIIIATLVATIGLSTSDVLAQEGRRSSYFCACDQRKCDCRFHAQKPGKCVCGKPLKARTVKYACDCGRECECGSISMKPGDCVCGKPMKAVK